MWKLLQFRHCDLDFRRDARYHIERSLDREGIYIEIPEYNYDDVRDLVDSCRPKFWGPKSRANSGSSVAGNWGHTRLSDETSQERRQSQALFSGPYDPKPIIPRVVESSFGPSNDEAASYPEATVPTKVFTSSTSDRRRFIATNAGQRVSQPSGLSCGEHENSENDNSRRSVVQTRINESLSVNNSCQSNARQLSTESKLKDEINRNLRPRTPLSDSDTLVGTPSPKNVNSVNTENV